VAVVAALEAGGFLGIVALAAWGLAFERERRTAGLPWLILGLVAASELPYALSVSQGLYHSMVMALLMPYAGAGLVGLAERPARLWEALRRPAVIAVLAVFALIQLEYGLIIARNV
jgi:hypothetical protein